MLGVKNRQHSLKITHKSGSLKTTAGFFMCGPSDEGPEKDWPQEEGASVLWGPLLQLTDEPADVRELVCIYSTCDSGPYGHRILVLCARERSATSATQCGRLFGEALSESSMRSSVLQQTEDCRQDYNPTRGLKPNSELSSLHPMKKNPTDRWTLHLRRTFPSEGQFSTKRFRIDLQKNASKALTN